MLILSRKENESIIITLPSGEEIKLKVTNIKKDSVRIGIEAAKDISIKRKEICKTS